MGTRASYEFLSVSKDVFQIGIPENGRNNCTSREGLWCNNVGETSNKINWIDVKVRSYGNARRQRNVTVKILPSQVMLF